jgi:hypothetical protein
LARLEGTINADIILVGKALEIKRRDVRSELGML